ncbi:MAG: DUF2934 domain-containing protein [Methylomonas lenta]|jgi:hypothetical protein|nr:DUF2934 domain-containing protein [Methylomonas lenta]
MSTKANPSTQKLHTPSVETAEVIPEPEIDERIAELAYYKAECRGFEPGYELQDWLEAEKEISML